MLQSETNELVKTGIQVLGGGLIGYLAAIAAFKTKISVLEETVKLKISSLETQIISLQDKLLTYSTKIEGFQSRQNVTLHILAAIATKLEIDKRATDMINRLIVDEIRS